MASKAQLKALRRRYKLGEYAPASRKKKKRRIPGIRNVPRGTKRKRTIKFGSLG